MVGLTGDSCCEGANGDEGECKEGGRKHVESPGGPGIVVICGNRRSAQGSHDEKEALGA